MTIEKNSGPLIVIGGGAAGMIAAWRAGALGARVVLLEKNAKLGIKLLISGGGKCNITHGGDMEVLREQFIKTEGRFLKHAFFEFTNSDIIRLLTDSGVVTYERDDGRIFPKSGKAGDVVHALRRMMERVGVEIKLSTSVEEIVKNADGIGGVRTSDGIIPAHHVILASGGSSYPRTGTTGDGFLWAKDLGHTIVPLRPALAPIFIDPTPPASWQGVALRDCNVKAESAGKTMAQWRGDMLFTHEGISGPAALEISRNAFLALEQHQTAGISFDLVPEFSEAQLGDRVQQEILANGSRNVETLVEFFIPQRLAPFILTSAKVDGKKKCHQLKKEERASIVHTFKHWSIGRVKKIDLERGEVTAGGVELSEVEPKTMRSKAARGLYVCGEVLDIAGPVGGYNLQAAFSTGYVAGETAAKDSLRN